MLFVNILSRTFPTGTCRNWLDVLAPSGNKPEWVSEWVSGVWFRLGLRSEKRLTYLFAFHRRRTLIRRGCSNTRTHKIYRVWRMDPFRTRPVVIQGDAEWIVSISWLCHCPFSSIGPSVCTCVGYFSNCDSASQLSYRRCAFTVNTHTCNHQKG